MFYKEWSSDSFWLPGMGLDILPTENPSPLGEPLRIRPYYDPDDVKKLETTLRKVRTPTFYFHFNPFRLVQINAYLDRTDAATWWTLWWHEAKKHMEPLEPSPMPGSL